MKICPKPNMTSLRFPLLALYLAWGRSSGGNGDVSGGLAAAFSPSPARTRTSPAPPVSSSVAARRAQKGGGMFRKMTAARGSSDSNSSANGDSVAVGPAENRNILVGADGGTAPAIGVDLGVGSTEGTLSRAEVFDAVVNARYACTRFRRYQEPRDGDCDSDKNDSSDVAAPAASLSDPSVVRAAHECLTLSRRAPTGFNAQPYRVVLVHSPRDKERLAEFCLGRNADRVRDADCTAVFLADGECGREGRRLAALLGGRRWRRLRTLVLLFSSGYPLPRWLGVPLSFGVRLGVSVLAFAARRLRSLKRSFPRLPLVPDDVQLLPTLTSAETWSQKNTMLVAMTFLLACASRGLATCPMEGFDAAGVRRALGIPRGRYSIPLIASVGAPHLREREETDDAGVSHGGACTSPRFPVEEVLYGNSFGEPFLAT